jgi:hypothetical protein
MPKERDDDAEALAQAFEAEQRGRRSKRRRGRTSPSRKRTRAWWASSAVPAGGGEGAPQTATPAPTPEDGAEEAPEMTTAQFLDGMGWREDAP